MATTKIFKMDDNNIDFDTIRFCAEVIRSGGNVAFPTETVYGLGANAFNEKACAKIFAAKRRPPEKALILHMADGIDPADFAIVNDMYYKLKAIYPCGPLTFVLPRKAVLPEVVTANGDTIAFRFPANKIAKEFIRACGVPIAAPSANISGNEPPKSAKPVIDNFSGIIDCIIDGGECDIGTPSTIVLLIGEPKILREGTISGKEVLECLR
ncbi:MAG: threonylcarbamoyl-AMP synthase [Clostridiales bacterium GWF2_38_85]|nr:MAG: threonylcarbamoyl-AMP synthase [Clostridiales bacterium GWF2_38_85]HBL83811.1 threonylcarbamoyl-AMP synthase [Clostridiales bacterium]